VRWTTEITPIYNKVFPWGWNAALIRRLREAGISGDVMPSAEQMAAIRRLSARQTAVRVLGRLRVLLPDVTVGDAFVFNSVEQVQEFVLHTPSSVLKAPWSGSGRGIQYAGGIFPLPQRKWVERVIRTQQAVIGEPFYERVIDFAMEFYAFGDGNIRFVGYSLFETDKRGSYIENVLAADEAIENRLADYVPIAWLHRLRDVLSVELRMAIGKEYQGYLGVDMMVCRLSDGRYALHPCVEINLRMNMGVVSRLFYDRYVHQGVSGRYVVEYYSSNGEACRADEEFRKQYPLQIEEGKIRSGYLSLTPVMEDTAYQVYVIIEGRSEES
ncbi:MAG: hypothetical protein Q4D36_06215, partial [Bacteroidales bacterium]|nr:hypothetical protein [Bacteroidales bacterium]